MARQKPIPESALKREFYNVRDAAALLGLSAVRVRQFCQERRLGTWNGSSYTITRQELRDFSRVDRPHGKPAEKRSKD